MERVTPCETPETRAQYLQVHTEGGWRDGGGLGVARIPYIYICTHTHTHTHTHTDRSSANGSEPRSVVSLWIGDDHGDRPDAGGAIFGQRNARGGSRRLAEAAAIGGEENRCPRPEQLKSLWVCLVRPRRVLRGRLGRIGAFMAVFAASFGRIGARGLPRSQQISREHRHCCSRANRPESPRDKTQARGHARLGGAALGVLADALHRCLAEVKGGDPDGEKKIEKRNPISAVAPCARGCVWKNFKNPNI